MSNRDYLTAAWIGGILGIAVGIFFLVYLSMKDNSEQDGCVLIECPGPLEQECGE